MFSDIENVKGLGILPWQKAVALYSIHRQYTKAGKKTGPDGGGLLVSGSLVSGSYKPNADTEQNTHHSLTRFLDLMQMISELASDPKLMGLQQRLVSSTQIDYSNISKYLHLAEFSPDHIMLLDKAPIQKLAMHHSADDLVGLVCWLAVDIDKALRIYMYRDELPNEVGFLAENFADRYLSPTEDLLLETDKHQRNDLLDRLTHHFQEIMRWHPPVDALTQEVADVVEAYLTMGKQETSKKSVGTSLDDTQLLSGSAWFDMWEMLCLDNELEALLPEWKVLIVDAGNLPKRLEGKLKPETFALEDNPNFEESHQWLYFDGKRPDLVLYQVENGIVTYRIIDFKYYDFTRVKAKPKVCETACDDAKSFYCDKCKNDIQKSQSYAFGVQRFHMAKYLTAQIRISLEFWVAADDQQTQPIEVFNPYQCLVPKAINDMIEQTLRNHKAFAH